MLSSVCNIRKILQQSFRPQLWRLPSIVVFLCLLLLADDSGIRNRWATEELRTWRRSPQSSPKRPVQDFTEMAAARQHEIIISAIQSAVLASTAYIIHSVTRLSTLSATTRGPRLTRRAGKLGFYASSGSCPTDDSFSRGCSRSQRTVVPLDPVFTTSTAAVNSDSITQLTNRLPAGSSREGKPI